MLLSFLACGLMCAQPVSVAITASATPASKSQTRFTIVASDPHVRLTNPDFIALSKDLSRVLETQGFEPAKTPEDGNLVVLLDWGVSDPKVEVRHVGADATPQVSGAAAGTKGMPVGGTNNSASFGFGAGPQDAETLRYTRTFSLKGVDSAAYKADPAAKPLWELALASEDSSDDIVAAGPPMLAAAMPYIGQNAGKVRVRVSKIEDTVKYVRGDLPALPVVAKK